MIELGAPKLLEQLLNHFGRAGRDGRESTCTLIYKPQDFNGHEAHVNWDERTGKLSQLTRQRLVHSITQLRGFAANVTRCRWRFLMEHYGESADDNWRCSKCDNCLRLLGEKEPEEDTRAKRIFCG